MTAPIPIAPGTRFARLTVVRRAHNNERGSLQYRCRCDCGAEVIVRSHNLRKGATRSCGCLAKDIQRTAMKRRNGVKSDAPDPQQGFLDNDWDN